MVDLKKYSVGEIEEAFSNAYKRPAAYHYIETYDVVCEEDFDNGRGTIINVEVSSMANSPTKEQFSGVEDLQYVEIELLVDRSLVAFEVVEVMAINGLEYNVIYAQTEIRQKNEEVSEVSEESDSDSEDEETFEGQIEQQDLT